MKHFHHTGRHFVLFFAGISVALGLAYALTIETSMLNTIQYIQKSIISSNGTSEGTHYTVLNNDNSGEAYFSNKIGIGTSGSNAKLNIKTNAYNEIEFSNTESADIVSPNADLHIKTQNGNSIYLESNN